MGHKFGQFIKFPHKPPNFSTHLCSKCFCHFLNAEQHISVSDLFPHVSDI